jgi:hypothetical protein
MYQKFTLIILCFASVFTAKAQISITSTTFTYVENFNSLVNSGTSSALPTGWAFNETGSSGNTTFTAGTGSSNSGDTYSFGLTSNSERALGSIRSGSVASTYGVGFVYNGTEGRLASMSITYTGETWRTGVTTSRTDKLDFQYSTTATSITSGTWIDFDALDYVGPASAAIASGSMLSSASISGTITGLYIPIGGQIWFRFVDSDATGSDDGLAVDDFTVAPVTLPVEISFFDVISNSRNKNTLNWQTASEKDNAYFEVQHATNGIERHNHCREQLCLRTRRPLSRNALLSPPPSRCERCSNVFESCIRFKWQKNSLIGVSNFGNKRTSRCDEFG